MGGKAQSYDWLHPPILFKEDIMSEKHAYSRRQFAESGFDTTDYAFNEIPGLHTATIDCKRWGKQKLVTYFTFDDGRKIVAPTWPKSNYLGLAELPVGSRVELDFQYTRTGKLNLKGVSTIDNPMRQA